MVKKICVRVLSVVKWLLLIVLVALLISTLTHQIMTVVETQQNPPLGKMVSVDGKKMSIYITGSGAHTIVLMPGLGTASPILDFMPLTEELAESNRVVVVEPFGYGWSDVTTEERTVQNQVEELRTALQQAGISGPYVLMPHSISGLSAIYYCNTYPNEVEAVIGIDCTLPKMNDYFEEELPGKLPNFLGLLRQLGVVRWLTLFSPDNFISDNSHGIYSEENLAMQRCIASWTADNQNVIDQMNHIEQDMAATKALMFPEDMPLLLFCRDKR